MNKKENGEKQLAPKPVSLTYIYPDTGLGVFLLVEWWCPRKKTKRLATPAEGLELVN